MNMKPITLLATALFLLAPASARADGERPDAIRVRGGLSADGGFAIVSSNAGSAVAETFGISGRLGVQLNHYFSLYYQNMVVIPIAGGQAAGVFDYNSFLPNLTLGHMVDLGAGPSCDIMYVSAPNASATAVLPGLQTRLAVNIGGDHGNEPRRSGLSLGLDVHPTWGPGGIIVTAGAGVGYEWF